MSAVQFNNWVEINWHSVTSNSCGTFAFSALSESAKLLIYIHRNFGNFSQYFPF